MSRLSSREYVDTGAVGDHVYVESILQTGIRGYERPQRLQNLRRLLVIAVARNTNVLPVREPELAVNRNGVFAVN